MRHAEHSAALNAAIAVSAEPNSLQIVGADLSVRTLPLAVEPLKVALTPDGRQAVVGHEKFITHIDLVSGAILATHSVPAAAIDFVAPGNGFSYLFPRDRNFRHVIVVNLATGATSEGPEGRRWTDARYSHYAGAIFAVEDPDRIHRYPLAGAQLSRAFALPGTNSARVGSEIWFDGSGQRLITERGSVFRASPAKFSDLNYLGELELNKADRYAAIRSVSHSAQKQQLLVIQKTSERFSEDDTTSDLWLRVYEDNYLRLTALLPMPCIADGPHQIPSHGRYVFAVNQGTAALLLLQLTGTPALNDWAVALLPL